MCGKFMQMPSWREARAVSNLFSTRVDDDMRCHTPMRAVPVLHLDRNGERIIMREFSSHWEMNIEDPSKIAPAEELIG